MLVVADELIAGFVALALSHGIFDVERVRTIDAARDRRRVWKPHLLIVDVATHDGDAMELIAEHPGARRTPTIVLTDRGDLKIKLEAFQAGADDFISRPTTPEELVARVLALVRRAYGDDVPFKPTIAVAGLEIDLLNRLASVGGKQLELTPMEQALLYLLASNPARILDRETILDSIWGSEFIAESNLVDRHIRNLRVKLDDDWRHPRFIKTVPGRGYQFMPASSTQPAPEGRSNSTRSGGGRPLH